MLYSFDCSSIYAFVLVCTVADSDSSETETRSCLERIVGSLLPVPASALSNQMKGIFFCLVGVLSISPDALFYRLEGDLPNYTVMFNKYATMVAAFVIMLISDSNGGNIFSKFSNLGLLGFFAGAILGVDHIFFTLALQTGIVGNVLVIVASNSLFSAVFSYFFFGDPLKSRTLIACLVSIFST